MLTRRTAIVLSAAVVIIFASLSSRSSAIDKIPASKPAPVAPKAGYTPLPKGTVRIWDTRKHYGPGLRMGLVEWEDRQVWKQAPHGKTDVDLAFDTVLEGVNFYVDFPGDKGKHSCPKLYAKKKPDGTPSRRDKLYQVGKGSYGGKLNYIRILKNDPAEAVLELSVGPEKISRWRALAGKPWVEITPVKNLDNLGMHGESRFVVCPEAAGAGQDYAYDAFKHPEHRKKSLWAPPASRMLLDFIMDDDTIWVLTWMPVKGKTKRARFYPYNGWHAGWSLIGEGACSTVASASHAYFEGKKVVIGVLRIGYWNYQKIDADVEKGENFTIKWKHAYQRKVTSSPFKPNGPWWPMHAGKWRMVSCIDGKFYTTPITIGKDGVRKKTLTFKPPVNGKLEYVLIYLYDRTKDTGKDVYTPMDIYRQAILGKK